MSVRTTGVALTLLAPTAVSGARADGSSTPCPTARLARRCRLARRAAVVVAAVFCFGCGRGETDVEIRIFAEEARTALITKLENDLPDQPYLKGTIDRLRSAPVKRLGIMCDIDNFSVNLSSLEFTWYRLPGSPDRYGAFRKRADGRWEAEITRMGPIP